MKTYELIPKNGRKSFYGKAVVQIDEATGDETLLSYGTPVIRRSPCGVLTGLCDAGAVTTTTSSHIKSFCGLDKRGFEKLLAGK